MRAFGHENRNRGLKAAAAHAVVAGAVGAADDHGVAGHARVGDGVDELGGMFRDAAALRVRADHEAGDVLQEQDRRSALVAQFNEMRALHGGFGEQNAVVGEDADRLAMNPGEAADQRRAVGRLEFLKFAAVDDARDHFANVVGLLEVGRRRRRRVLSDRRAARAARDVVVRRCSRQSSVATMSRTLPIASISVSAR